MKLLFHPGLSVEKWQGLGREKQLLNIASELSRVKHWIREGQSDLVQQALERALELVDLTVESTTTRESYAFVRELLRFREILSESYLQTDREEGAFSALMRELLNLNAGTHNLSLEI